MKTFHAYTDGACSSNPGPGGAAAVVIPQDGESLRIYQGYARTTNNRMELAGIILALKLVLDDDNVEPGDILVIHTDSQIAYGGLALGWKRKANTDLWKEIDRLLVAARIGRGITVRFEKVEGHAGHQWNELADRLAVAACTMTPLLPDEGYAGPAEIPVPSTETAEPGLFDDTETARESISADDVSQFLANEAGKDGCAYELLANMFASHELSLERLARELTKHMS